MIDTAIVVFGFNRPESLKRLLASLSLCPEHVDIPIYICLDAPRHTQEAQVVASVRAIAEGFYHPNKTIIARERNLGLQASLRSGISEVLNRHDAVIVLEDDLVLGQYALDYFLRGLDRYQGDNRVASICGYALMEGTTTSTAARFLPMTHPWGWATWRDRWESHMTTLGNIAPPDLLKSRSFKAAMNVYGLRNFLQMLKLAENGLVSSWWIYWHLHAVSGHQLSLFPVQTQVINLGLDGAGTHSSRFNILRGKFSQKKMSQVPAIFPEGVVAAYAELDLMITSRESRLLRVNGFLGALKRHYKRFSIK